MSTASPLIPLQPLQIVFSRELKTLEAEISAYTDDASLWRRIPGITNPGGNLALHLCGNLQHFIGACLGGSGYVRDRTAEFESRSLSREELRERVQETRRVVHETLKSLTASHLESDFPETVGGLRLNTASFLVHLASHLAFHLGQIDFHRRMTTGESALPGALTIAALLEGDH